jgi:uncharacterized protein with HEPN domain
LTGRGSNGSPKGRASSGFRRVLIHGYDAISNAVAWRIASQKLPELSREVDAMLAEAE